MEALFELFLLSVDLDRILPNLLRFFSFFFLLFGCVTLVSVVIAFVLGGITSLTSNDDRLRIGGSRDLERDLLRLRRLMRRGCCSFDRNTELVVVVPAVMSLADAFLRRLDLIYRPSSLINCNLARMPLRAFLLSFSR